MKYLCLVYLDEKRLDELPDEDCVAYDNAIRDSGHCIASEALTLALLSGHQECEMAPDRASEAATLSALLESLPGPALLVDLKRRVRAVNAAFRARIPRPGAMREAHCFELLHGRRRRCASKVHTCPLDLCVGSRAPVVAFHAHLRGRRTGIDQALPRPLVDDDGKVVACLATLEPVAAGVKDRPRVPGESRVAVASVPARLPRLAAGNTRILLVGEAGTGKAWEARDMHRRSGSRGPFEERSGCELTAEGLRGLLEGTPAGGTLAGFFPYPPAEGSIRPPEVRSRF